MVLARPEEGFVSLERGLELMRAERWFDAHEALEDEWRDAPEPERDFLQGLVHVTVAWHHAANGNRPGAERQLEKAARRLGPYARTRRARVLGRSRSQRPCRRGPARAPPRRV